MNKNLVIGVIAGIVIGEVLDYFAPRSAVLFYCYIFIGAFTAAAIGRKAAAGLIIAGYVVAMKVVGVYLLTRSYGAQAVASSFYLFLLDWALVVLVAAAAGYAGVAGRRKYDDRAGAAA